MLILALYPNLLNVSLFKKQGRKPSARPHASYGVYSISANALLLEKVTKLLGGLVV